MGIKDEQVIVIGKLSRVNKSSDRDLSWGSWVIWNESISHVWQLRDSPIKLGEDIGEITSLVNNDHRAKIVQFGFPAV